MYLNGELFTGVYRSTYYMNGEKVTKDFYETFNPCKSFNIEASAKDFATSNTTNADTSEVSSSSDSTTSIDSLNEEPHINIGKYIEELEHYNNYGAQPNSTTESDLSFNYKSEAEYLCSILVDNLKQIEFKYTTESTTDDIKYGINPLDGVGSLYNSVSTAIGLCNLDINNKTIIVLNRRGK